MSSGFLSIFFMCKPFIYVAGCWHGNLFRFQMAHIPTIKKIIGKRDKRSEMFDN